MDNRHTLSTRTHVLIVVGLVAIAAVGNALIFPAGTGAWGMIAIIAFNAALLAGLYALLRALLHQQHTYFTKQLSQAHSQLSGAQSKLDERDMLITINQLTELYLECEELEPVLKSLAYSVIELLKVDTVLVYTFNPHTNGRIHQICVGETLSNADTIAETLKGSTANNKSVLVNSTSTNNRFHMVDPDEASSLMATAFAIKSRQLGFIATFTKDERDFLGRDLEVLVRYTRHASLLIDSARMIEENKKLSLMDELTGLANKREFNRRLAREFQRSKRYGRNLSLVTFDIDNFKHYNDTNGHPAGDKLLAQLGDLIHKNIRTTDFAARVGGEEFALILLEESRDQARQFAEKVRTLVSEYPFEHREKQPLGTVSISLGLSAFPEDTTNLPDLIKTSDLALYRSKFTGRNRVTCYEPDMKG